MHARSFGWGTCSWDPPRSFEPRQAVPAVLVSVIIGYNTHSVNWTYSCLNFNMMSLFTSQLYLYTALDCVSNYKTGVQLNRLFDDYCTRKFCSEKISFAIQNKSFLAEFFCQIFDFRRQIQIFLEFLLVSSVGILCNLLLYSSSHFRNFRSWVNNFGKTNLVTFGNFSYFLFLLIGGNWRH